MTRAALLALALFAAPLPALAESPPISRAMLMLACVDGDALLQGAPKMGERQLLHGDAGKGTQMVLVTNPDTAKWSVLLVMPEGACILATGEAMTPGAIEPRGEPS